MEVAKTRRKRTHSAELKAEVLAGCAEPGASVAAIALARGLNTNLVHKWRRQAARPAGMPVARKAAATVPPPRLHRHRYFGVLAPNSPLRAAVTALAPGATTAPPAPIAEPAAEPAHRRAARHTWALLLARIYEVRGGPTQLDRDCRIVSG